ncbi:MAG TPA: 50S ribosomal protein L25 [Candidatus Kapabacteria bacterium]|jgi:large subunit ribosomal protein L25|nr:50S ribosomal protein L25 [Candidatus Kapabacteria bacterium]
MSEILLEARLREPGRSAARALRRQGVVPGIYYFHGQDPIALAATELALRPLIYTAETHIIRLRLEDGSEKTCILKEVTFDPITDRATHFDLQGVSADERVRVEVPIALTGSSIGVREGGVLDFHLHKVEIECLPKDLPEHIDVDIASLAVGQSLHVSDLDQSKYTILSAQDATIVAVIPPRVEMVEATAAAAVTGEPELISKAKDE